MTDECSSSIVVAPMTARELDLQSFSFTKKVGCQISYLFIYLRAVLFNLFCITEPCRIKKKIWWHPYLAKMTISGTVSGKRLKKAVNSIFGGIPYSLHLFTAPMCAVAPQLGITALESTYNITYLMITITFTQSSVFQPGFRQFFTGFRENPHISTIFSIQVPPKVQ